jgi:hypothetical protein
MCSVEARIKADHYQPLSDKSCVLPGDEVARRATSSEEVGTGSLRDHGANAPGNRRVALVQLKDVLDAFLERDADHAFKVWLKDENIDAMYNSVFRELLTYMMEDPLNIGICTHLLFGAKNLERIGDHATNIAETIYFLVHGRAINDQRPKGDNTSITLLAMRA